MDTLESPDVRLLHEIAKLFAVTELKWWGDITRNPPRRHFAFGQQINLQIQVDNPAREPFGLRASKRLDFQALIVATFSSTGGSAPSTGALA